MKVFFEPESVAVFGSMRDGKGLGFRAITNMLTFGYGGRVYPVNPSCDEVLGIRSMTWMGPSTWRW